VSNDRKSLSFARDPGLYHAASYSMSIPDLLATTDSSAPKSDWIVRLLEVDRGLSVTVAQTSELVNRLDQQSEYFKTVVETLSRAFHSARVLVEFQSTYQEFAAGLTSEEEFEHAAARYSLSHFDESAPRALERIKILMKVTGDQFTPGELSQFLRLREDLVHDALAQLSDGGEIAASDGSMASP